MDAAQDRTAFMIRRCVAYGVTFAAFFLAGTMDNMRIWVQIGMFFCGLIAANVFSFIIFMFVASILPFKSSLWVHIVMFIAEVAASVFILDLLVRYVSSL